MTDWNNPTTTRNYSTQVLPDIKGRDESCAKMDYSGDSNIPLGTIAYDVTTNRLKRWNGSSYDNIHPGFDVGDIKMVGHDGVSDGWLLCDGSEVSQATYAALFAKIGSAYNTGNEGGGNFSLPNFKGRSPIGRDSSVAEIDSIGASIGSLNHTHSTPAHTHAIPAHTHAIPSHTHSIPPHFHDTQAPGATIQINVAAGAHTHGFIINSASANGSITSNHRRGGSAHSADSYTTGVGGAHTHPHSTFAGRVGRVSGGQNGDATMTSGASGGTTGATAATSGSGGSGTSGTANSPAIVVNFMIKV